MLKLSPELKELGSRIKPMGDRIAWIRLEYKHPTLKLPSLKTNRGIALAVGPGKRVRRKQTFALHNGETHTARVGGETGKRFPMDVKAGDVLEFSPHGQFERVIDGVSVVFSEQDSVICFADKNDTQGLMFPTDAGFGDEDKHRQVVGRY